MMHSQAAKACENEILGHIVEAIKADRAQRNIVTQIDEILNLDALREYEVTINYPLTGKSHQVYVTLEPGESITEAVMRSGDATDEWTLEEVVPLP